MSLHAIPPVDVKTSDQEQLSIYPLGRERGIYQSFLERFAPYLAEILGTFVLTAVYILTKIDAEPNWAISANAFMMVTLIASFGHLSGANLNPSITVSLYLCGRTQGYIARRICLAQVFGAACAAGCVRIAGALTHPIDLGPKEGYSSFDALTIEFIFTAMICFVYLNSVASPKSNPARDQNAFGALATGLSMIAGGHAAQSISGSVMNPAIAFGLQLAAFGEDTLYWWATFLFIWEIFGAFIAAGMQRIVRPSERENVPGLSSETEESASTSAIIAEYLGTFYIIFTKVMMHKRLSANEPWAVTSAITAMMYSLRGVSGAHFNPVLTLTVKLGPTHFGDWQRVAKYVGAQIMGGVTATCWAGAIDSSADIDVRPPNGDSSRIQIMVAESLFTFLVSYVMLTTSIPDPPTGSATVHNNVAGIATGGAYFVSGLSVGKISGSVLNPAVVLGYSGLAGLTGDLASLCLPYIFYQIFGAVCASLAYRALHAHTEQKPDCDVDSAGTHGDVLGDARGGSEKAV